jgi:polyisoprenoid-binding protein YceI
MALRIIKMRALKMIRSFKILLLIIIISSNFLFAAEYQVDHSQKNVVKFISHAPMDDFEGVTDKIDGYIYWKGDSLLNNSDMYFEVDLNSIDTGIGLRNRHMRDNYLETDKYPYTHFKGKLTRAGKLSDNEYDVTAEGTMFIHGVEKQISVKGKMTAMDNGYRIQANFITALTDYKITVPKLMFFKINENMQLELDFYVKKIEKNQ